MAIIPFPFGALSTAVSLLVMHGISITMFRAFLNQTIPSLETLRTSDKYHITLSRPGGGSSGQDSLPTNLNSISQPLMNQINQLVSSPKPPIVNLFPPAIGSGSGGGGGSSFQPFSGSLTLTSNPVKSAAAIMAESLLASASSRNPFLSASASRFNLINPTYQNSIHSGPIDKLIFSGISKALPGLVPPPPPSSSSSQSQQPPMIPLAPPPLPLPPPAIPGMMIPHPRLFSSPSLPPTSPIGSFMSPGPHISFTPLLSKRVGNSKTTAILFSQTINGRKKSSNEIRNQTKLNKLMVKPIIKEISLSKFGLHSSMQKFSLPVKQIIPTIRRVCYFLLDSPGQLQLKAQDLDDLEFCTHLIVSDAVINTQHQLTFQDAYRDSQTLRTLSRLRQSSNSPFKLLLSIGSARNDSNQFVFERLCQEESNMRTFIDSVLEVAAIYDLDGVDLNLKFSNQLIDIHGKQKQRLGKLLQMFRLRLNQVGLDDFLITAILSNSPQVVDAYYDLNEFEKSLDFVSVIAYELHDEDMQKSIASHHSALYSVDKRNNNLDWLANYWLNSNMPKNKINIGLSTFGRTYNLAYNNVRSINVPISGLGINNGTVGYRQICEFLHKPETTYIYNERLQVPFAYNGYDLIAFENEKSLTVKCRYVCKQQFGGIMLFALNFDDFDGVCRPSGDEMALNRFPLHNAVYKTLQFAGMTKYRRLDRK